MIPRADIEPTVPRALPECRMPGPEEISEEGFGYFRGTWLIDDVRIKDAVAVVAEEAEIIRWIDDAAPDADTFESLATAIESQDLDSLQEPLSTTALERGIERFITEEFPPLEGLEIGVSGLTHALAAVGCLTAASCRSHVNSRSWSDFPVVFFAARPWRIEILADLVSAQSCGLEPGRDMLTLYGASILDTHRLAETILAERRRFRRRPHPLKPSSSRPTADDEQLELFSD